MKNEIETNEIKDKFKTLSEDKLELKEDSYKTSSNIINNLLVGYFHQDSNINNNSGNNLIKIGKKENLDIIKKQKLFASKKYYTKKELKKKVNDILQKKKRASIKNFQVYRLFLKNQINQLDQKFCINIENKKKYIENDDLYFGDDMFIPESSSFPNEKEEDFFLKLQFIEENDYNEDIEDHSIRYCSISHKNDQRDPIHSKFFDEQKKEFNGIKLFEFDNVYKEENEIPTKNICYVDIPKIINKKNMINEINEQTISYISLNLLIKKVTLENFRNKYSFIYKCFLEQFKYFISINNLVNKIISAFNYYFEIKKIDTTELLLFLNTLIYGNFDIIKEDKITLKQLQKFISK